MPAGSPLTVWLPLAAELLRPLPVTATDAAFALDQVIVVDPGELALVGLALMDAVTVAGALTVNVAVCVAGPP